jgi:DNA recombination protein RmuC
MDGIWVIAAAVVFFGVGLAIGLVLRRQAVAAARQEGALEAREAAAAAANAGRAAEQERAVALAAELARARAGAERAAELEAALGEQRETATRLLAERSRLQADLEAERRAAAERAAEAERARQAVRSEIEVLAGRLLEEKGKAMLERSREGLQALLGPLGEKLRAFEAKVEKTYDQENRDRASLLQSLQLLQATQSKLHDDARALARALTGESKAQGDWGELVLERVLETAGLTEGREYELQVSHTDEEGGRKRPDALVYLPGDRAIVVDAKCSLTAFVESMRAVDDEVREAALGRHVASLRAHVKGLAGKGYQDVLRQRTLDIVLLFVPNEAAFHAAIAREAGLYEEAFRQGVVLCSPTTLLAALQLVGHVWRSEKQNANAQRIAEEAGRLLDKLTAFVGDLDAVGARLGQAQESFAAARAKLATGRGNVMKKAADIAKLGARVKGEKVHALLVEAGEDDRDEEVGISLSLREAGGEGRGEGGESPGSRVALTR